MRRQASRFIFVYPRHTKRFTNKKVLSMSIERYNESGHDDTASGKEDILAISSKMDNEQGLIA